MMDQSEFQLQPEHALILTALQEQQAQHEQIIQRMLEDLLQLIEQKIPIGCCQSDGCLHKEELACQPESEGHAMPKIDSNVQAELFSTHVRCQAYCESGAAATSPVVLLPQQRAETSDPLVAEATRTEEETCCSSSSRENAAKATGQGDVKAKVLHSLRSSTSLPTTRQGFVWSLLGIEDFSALKSGASSPAPYSNEGQCLGKYNPRRLSRVLVSSRSFEYVVMLLILANGVVLGIQQDLLVRSVGGTVDPVFFTLDVIFAGAFSLELSLRIIASGLSFLSLWNKDLAWNLFDSALVTSGITEVAMKFNGTEPLVDPSTGRLLRLLRLVRVVRILRVMRFFKDLRVMILSIMCSLRSLVFALMLLGILIYVVSIWVMQFVTEELIILSKLEGGRELPSFVALTDLYGSLTRTAYTLFMSISGGVSWGEACNPLLDISPLLGLCFILYVALSVLCVLNVITGIFVEEATTKTQEDEETMLIHETRKRMRFVDEAKRFFEEADVDGSGELTWPEFKERLEHIRMQKLLEKLGIDVMACGVRNVFELFDFDGNGNIDISEFTAGLQQLRGNARSIEVARVAHEQKRLRKEVNDLVEACQEVFKGGLVNALTPNPQAPRTGHTSRHL